MKFDIFTSVRQQTGKVCSLEDFLGVCYSKDVYAIAKELKTIDDPDERQKLKKKLPIITWQASYSDHHRTNATAIPSGLYMLDIDHIDDEKEMRRICETAFSQTTDFKIVYIGKSISGKGVRIVAECRPEFSTLEQCQRWLSEQLKTEFDSACKDFARASYVVPEDYVLFFDQSIFQREPSVVYSSTEANLQPAPHFEDAPSESNANLQKDYQGFSLKDIAAQWLEETGGMPVQGERNQRLYNCAFAMKYICDFNPAVLLDCLPDCGLSHEERWQIVKSACSGPRSTQIPHSLENAIASLRISREAEEAIMENDEVPEELQSSIEKFADVFTTDEVPVLPPIFQEFYNIAPPDFKLATVLCLLPFLGTLASRLRAQYRGREVHSPSFLVTLEAPQAQGKSFIKILDEVCLGRLKEQDAKQREAEREWKEYRKMVKDLGTKLTKKESQDFMDSKPNVRIRYVAPTMSVTELMRKMDAAEGLHLFAMSTEIDTVYKAMKRDFSNFSDILRKAFDNDEIGQDYASDSSWSGIVKLFYNCIYSGTPKAVRRFFPDVEDGLISRVLFVTLPDQTFKQGQVFGLFTPADLERVNYHLNRLDSVSVFDGMPREEHLLKLNFLTKHMEKWVLAQQHYAEKLNDVTRDTFCRRSAVIGFRAGMIAFYLWDEVTTPTIMRKVKNFAVWIANCALRQFLMRFKIEHDTRNTFKYQDVYRDLPDSFDFKAVTIAAAKHNMKTPTKNIVYQWQLAGKITKIENGTKNPQFKKI